MAINHENALSSMLQHLSEEYNDFSKLVALNFSQGARAETAEWNRARKTAAARHLEYLAGLMEISLEYTGVVERFCGYDLEYTKVTL